MDADDHFKQKQDQFDLEDDDSDDDTNSYKTFNVSTGDRNYVLELVMKSNEISSEQRTNFINMLNKADGIVSENNDDNNARHRLHYRFRSILVARPHKIVNDWIINEGKTRIVLSYQTYKKCMKFKRSVSKQIEEQLLKNRKKKNVINEMNNFYPEFELKVMPKRHSLHYNFGLQATSRTNYFERRTSVATQQTRTKYEFQYTPVLQRIAKTNK